jgi:hypothetical protein
MMTSDQLARVLQDPAFMQCLQATMADYNAIATHAASLGAAEIVPLLVGLACLRLRPVRCLRVS